MAPSTTQVTAESDASSHDALPKAPTGIRGLDEVTGGGLPRGRPTLVCGPAGSGKTLLAMEFLVRGITQFGEPGVFLAFEETREDLVANVASLGFDLAALEADGTLVVDHVNLVAAELVRGRRLGPGRAVHPARSGDRRGRGSPRRHRHDRDAVRRVHGRGHPALGAAAAVRVAQGPRRDGGHHRRAGRRAR